MKLAFLLLVLVNLLLFAWQQGVFGRYTETGREPERVARQIEPERIRVLTESEVQTLRQRAVQANAPLDLTVAQSCLEFGDFGPTEAARAERLLAPLLPTRPVVRPIELTGWYSVFIPPAKTRAEAERRAEELRKLGVNNVTVIGDNGPLRLGIALGAFRDADAARAHLTQLESLGVTGARVSDKPTTIVAVRYQWRDLDAAAVRQLAALRVEFPAQSLRACAAPA